MVANHLIRFSCLGHVGRFAAVDAALYPRGSRVVLRTDRGLEVGEVLASLPSEGSGSSECDGRLLREMTIEDHLLAARLEKNRTAAVEACARMLTERSIRATLLDVEPLFDGQRLYFYFLGDVPPEAEALTTELANAYEGTARLQSFGETLTHGCGPDCGTEQGGGCQTCGTCALADGCGVR